MIVFGPVMAVFCIGIFCLVMDIIYPTITTEETISYKPTSPKLSESLLQYDENDYDYNFEDNSQTIDD